MIVVIGSPVGWLRDEEVVPYGMAARAALAAAAAGSQVQLVGRTGGDAAADALLLSLARGGVGHVAVLRDPSRSTTLVPEPVGDDGPAAPPDDPPGDAPVPVPVPATPSLPPLDPADVDLGLRYLTNYAVVVMAEPAEPEVIRVVTAAAQWTAARLVAVVAAGAEPSDQLPSDAIVFEAPVDDPDGDFAGLVGRFAAALDDGADAADAFRSTVAAEGWTESRPD